MKKFEFSNTSLKRLATCHGDLQFIMKMAISVSEVDFGISEGYRSIKKQKEYFDQGKSKIDGITRKGKHNHEPSLACDIYAYVDGKASWDHEHITYLAGVITAMANYYYNRGDIEFKIRWGGNWDMDGEILLDQSFDDRPHFELIKPKP